MNAPFKIRMDWKDPDYDAIMAARVKNLATIREQLADQKRRGVERTVIDELKEFYAENPAAFINDWGVTFDPRNADVGLPTYIPFILFGKQREFIDYVLRKWRNREPGLVEKSRDVGASWLAMALSCTLCLFHNGLAIGFGSRKAEYVDKVGTLKALFPKARIFLQNVPKEFLGGFDINRDAPLMRIWFPDTGSLISGEGGDDIGRGDRTSFYMVDEAAHLERPELVDAALSQTTNCRIDLSSVNGMNNSFARKRWGGKIEPFIFDWRDDPRKDDDWYTRQVNALDPVVVAQEIDRDYQASVAGIVIPAAWARACVGAKRALGIAPSGIFGVAIDVADEGVDKNAAARTQGTTVVKTEEWSGKGGDIYQTVMRAFEICDDHGADFFDYDADGLGAGVRGDARVINDGRRSAHQAEIKAVGYRGSAGVFEPDGIVDGTIGREGDRGRTNKDYFLNRKAQGWWAVRKRAQATYRWRVEGVACDPDDILDINPDDPDAMKLVAEMSQATYSTNGAGKIVINKKPDGQKSPNRADAVVIRYAPKEAAPMRISPQVLSQVRRSLPGRMRLPMRRGY